MTQVAVLVVNYGSSALLEENLSPLAATAERSIVVVDCFTSLTERGQVEALAQSHGWKAVLLEDNVGFGAGINAAASLAISFGAEVLVPLNPDAIITEEALSALTSRAADHPRALVWPRIVTSSGASWFAGADLYMDDGSTAGRHRRADLEGRERREWATGACFAISCTMFSELRGFDEDYFLYWEDVDFSHRLLDTGGTLIPVDVEVIHDEGQTHVDKGQGKSETYYYYRIRNRLLYAAKHLDQDAQRNWRRSAPRASYRILLEGGRRHLLTSTAPWRALWQGLRDGRSMMHEPLPTSANSQQD